MKTKGKCLKKIWAIAVFIGLFFLLGNTTRALPEGAGLVLLEAIKRAGTDTGRSGSGLFYCRNLEPTKNIAVFFTNGERINGAYAKDESKECRVYPLADIIKDYPCLEDKISEALDEAKYIYSDPRNENARLAAIVYSRVGNEYYPKLRTSWWPEVSFNFFSSPAYATDDINNCAVGIKLELSQRDERGQTIILDELEL